MDTAAAQPFQPPAIPWRQPRKLEPLVDLGPGVDPQVCGQALARLCSEPDVLAVLAFGSRARGDAHADSDLDLVVICQDAELTPEGKLAGWRRYRERLGRVPVGVDLIVTGWRQAERMAGSRWHVMGDVAREGKVLYVAG
jgi:predicted nucleotidyltransferase